MSSRCSLTSMFTTTLTLVGCCWAMAAVASVEAVHYLKTSQSISLSVQELIECNYNILNYGCSGGYCPLALWKNKTVVAARISGFWFVHRTEDALEKAVAKQPVIIRLQGTPQLRKYKGGIMEYEALPGSIRGHSVLIVGYGTDPDGVKYWRFKNSWGEDWGEGGFGRIRRHVADKRGVWGMFMQPGLHPVLNI